MMQNINISKIISKLYLVIAFCFFIIGWIIAFISLIVAESDRFISCGSWSWWLIINALICGVIIFFIIQKDNAQGYRLILMIYLGMCLNWSISAVNDFLHSSSSKLNAVGVGHLLITVAYFIWGIFFGCDSDTVLGGWVNSSGLMRNTKAVEKPSDYSLQQVPNTTSELSAPIPAMPADIAVSNEVIRVEALFNYEANKEDPNEISFSQGEVMEITNNKGKWWQARKADGTVGIVPSNFLKVI